jgi:hypothetical protein
MAWLTGRTAILQTPLLDLGKKTDGRPFAAFVL